MKFITFDTETQQGKAFLACIDDGKNIYDTLINNNKDVINFLHLLHSKASTAFAYNLQYDVCALLKYFGYNAIVDTYLSKTLRYENLFIRAVPAKFLILTKYYLNNKELSYKEIKDILSKGGIKIKDTEEKDYEANKLIYRIEKFNKRVPANRRLKAKEFTAFDMWQFYEMSLDKASEKHLGERKGDIPKSWMNKLKTKFLNPKSRNKIIKYCRQDTRLTYKLSEKFIQMLADCGIYPRKFYSSAYIAKNFIKKNVDVPIINEDYDNGKGKDILKFMDNVYRGGRTEVFKRGSFSKVTLSDMNSAYGKGLADLKRIYHVELSNKINKTADYYFVDCEIDIPKNYINPVPVYLKMWKYPYGKMRATIDNRTVDNVLKAGGSITKIYQALNIYCNEDYPFKKVINRMYSQRKKSDSHNYIFKRIIVSYIGKLHEQKTFTRQVSEKEKINILRNAEQYRKMTDDFEGLIKTNCDTCYSIGEVQSDCRNSVCSEYRKEYKGITEPPTIHYRGDNIFVTEKKLGNGTNVIYAALVTSTIRNIMYEEGVKLGDSLISFLTDGIISTSPLKKYGARLGEFSLKYQGELFLLGSGMYQTKDYVKFRGFNSDKVNLKKLSKKNTKSKVMKIPILERTGIGRAITSASSFDQFNVLKTDHKKLNVNFDTNRIWATPFKNYGEALNKSINSEPLKV